MYKFHLVIIEFSTVFQLGKYHEFRFQYSILPSKLPTILTSQFVTIK